MAESQRKFSDPEVVELAQALGVPYLVAWAIIEQMEREEVTSDGADDPGDRVEGAL